MARPRYGGSRQLVYSWPKREVPMTRNGMPQIGKKKEGYLYEIGTEKELGLISHTKRYKLTALYTFLSEKYTVREKRSQLSQRQLPGPHVVTERHGNSQDTSIVTISIRNPGDSSEIPVMRRNDLSAIQTLLLYCCISHVTVVYL